MKAAVYFRTESGDEYMFSSDQTSPMLIADDIADQFGEELAWAYTWEVITDADIDPVTVAKWIEKLHEEAQENE